MAKRIFLVITLLAGISATGYGADDMAVFTRYQEIVQSETNAPAAIKKAKEYLISLSHDDFMAFIRQAGRQPEYAREEADKIVGMGLLANCYIQGPGKDEPTLLTLKQLSDPTLPSTWKMGLLDALQLEKRTELTESQVAAVTDLLSAISQNKPSSDLFRSFCLGKLGSLLYSQRELLTQKSPELKDALEKQDRTALPKRDDANVRQAAKLLDTIRDYKAVLQKTADEVKDEQIKANLKRRLTKWEPPSVTPTK